MDFGVILSRNFLGTKSRFFHVYGLGCHVISGHKEHKEHDVLKQKNYR